MSGPILQILGDGELVCSAQLGTRLGRARSFTSRIPVAVIVCAPIVGFVAAKWLVSSSDVRLRDVVFGAAGSSDGFTLTLGRFNNRWWIYFFERCLNHSSEFNYTEGFAQKCIYTNSERFRFVFFGERGGGHHNHRHAKGT